MVIDKDVRAERSTHVRGVIAQRYEKLFGPRGKRGEALKFLVVFLCLQAFFAAIIRNNDNIVRVPASGVTCLICGGWS